MINKLGSIKRIFGVLAIGGALLLGSGAAFAQTFHRGPASVYDQDRNWQREHRREEARRRIERERWERRHRPYIHARWRDRWGVWHRS